MKIAVNTRLLLPGRLDGIGWFTYESFRRIVRNHPEHEFHFLFDRKWDDQFVFPGVIPHSVFPQARHPLLFRWWYDHSIPRTLKKIGAGLFVSPDSMCSLRTKVPQHLVIHDLNFEHYPGDLKPHVSRYLRTNTPLFAKAARRIATVSEFSKNDIAGLYKIDKDLIDVVYNGVNEDFSAITGKDQDLARKKYSGGAPYFIFVSSIHPRKNLQRLLPAFDSFRRRTGENVKLVVVGRKFWSSSEMDNAFNNMHHKDDVIFTGPIGSIEMKSLVGSAIASVYPSYFEGFGIPVIEAFRCGTPVISSNVTSIPEVAGDAALLVNPFSIEEIENALFLLWTDQNLRSELVRKGHEQVKYFSWDRTSSLLWQSIEKTL